MFQMVAEMKNSVGHLENEKFKKGVEKISFMVFRNFSKFSENFEK